MALRHTLVQIGLFIVVLGTLIGFFWYKIKDMKARAETKKVSEDKHEETQ